MPTDSNQPRLEIRYRPTSEVAALVNPKNPRRMKDAVLARLQKSLAEFSMVLPIIINRRTNRIVGGHQRLAAAIRNADPEVPTVEVDLAEAQEAALNLALNRIKGATDTEKVAAVFRSIEAAAGCVPEITGYDPIEVEEVKVQVGDAPGIRDAGNFNRVVIKIPRADAGKVKKAIAAAKAAGAFQETTNVNSNGNAIARIADWLLAQTGA